MHISILVKFISQLKLLKPLEIAYNNLAISNIEIGMYQACQNFLKILAINKNNYFAQKNLIYILNLLIQQILKTINFEINSEIKKLVNNIKNNDISKFLI